MATAPVTRPNIYQFTVGDAVVTNILEGVVAREDLHPFVATNASADDVAALAAEYRIPFPALEHGFVVTVIEVGGKLIVIDPGFGAAAPGPFSGWFDAGFAAAGYKAEHVDVVAISHCHPDHIGHIGAFPNADIVIGKREFDYWKVGVGVSEPRAMTKALFDKVVVPLEDTLRFIEPGDEIVPGLIAVDAFGHSAGHLVFRLTSGEKELLLLNDTTPHYVASFAHPEWHFIMDDDADAAAITRKRILEMAASEELPVVGFHLPFPALGHVERRGEGYEFRPATYQFNLS